MNTPKQSNKWIFAISLLGGGFGIVTILASGTVLSGAKTASAAAGNYVPFIVWFNLIAGIAYVLAALALWLQKRYAVWLAIGIAIATAVTLTFLGLHISSGGVYEIRTVYVMLLRIIIWVTIAVVASTQIALEVVSQTGHETV